MYESEDNEIEVRIDPKSAPLDVQWWRVCGGTLHGNSGKLIGPDHASGYPESQICIWNITVQNGYMLSLNLNVDGYNDCSLDHIQVMEVQSEETISRGLICSGILTLKSNKSLRIVFHSDNDSTTGVSFNASWVSICGGTLDRNSGKLIGPDHASGYPENQICTWNITVLNGYMLSLNLNVDGYNKGTNCSLNHIQVMEVQSEETISRGLICSGILTLKSNKSLRIVFHSDNDSTTGVSFNASWVSICGGTLDRNSGKLIGPDHASGYPENQICTWNITVLNGYMLSLNLNVDGYNKGTNCSLDHIQVMEVQSEETISRGLICSGILTLKSNKSLRIVFHSDNDSTTGVSFNASWVSICGGTLDRNSGKLIGPDHASGYPENQICTWNITVLNGYMLSLNLNVDGYNKGTNCSLNHIQVMEVQSEETISRGLICSGILTLKSNKSLRIVFHSDNDSTTGVSFNASWVSICGGTLDRNSGKLIGPDHASGYPENQICTWNITVLNGYMLSLNLNVDGYNKGTNCSLDHIQVMEVQSEETISRGLICSGILTLKSNKSLRIVFHSDNDSTTGVSFNASWVSICGGTLDRNSGKLIGPDHASGYPENQICTWNITVLNGYMLSLNLNVDGYNKGTNCSLDHIQVMEVQSEETISRGLICSGILTLKSNKSSRIVFHSDNDSTTGVSFNASWVSICGGTLDRNSGKLIGPDHASGYPENQICTWNITVLNGYMLSLNLNVDGYNKGTNCSLDHIQVMEVQSEETISRGLICSGILTLKSNKSSRIVFHSDNDSTTGVSFNASWVSICGGTLDRNSGKLIGPDHASGYPENQICTWNITVLNGYMLSLNLNVDGYNKGTNCSLDHIQVMEVQSEETISRGLICSGILTLKSNKSSRIVFHSDNDSTTGVSFNASWVSICGGTLDRNSGKLIGPDHASGYPENQICTWNITVLNGYMLSLNLNVDGYNKGTNCSLDHIQVMEVQSEETISRGLICSGILTLKSNKSSRIVFHSDNDSTTGVSFNASWVSICGGTLDRNSGKLIGPDHASGYPENQICTWNITVLNGYMLSLNLNVDGYNKGTNCSLDHIQVMEVQSEETISRGLICSGILTLKSNKSLRIVFHSDNDSTTGVSFNASWVSICGGTLDRNSGKLIGPDHASGYPENQICTWNITVLNGYMLSLNLNVDGYNKGTNCSLDHIQVMEVQSEETISRGLICSGILTLKSNKSLRIVFHSDNDSTTGVSFNASWVSICGGTLDRNSGKLIGPDHASGYPENQICTWNITVLNGYMLSLNLNVDGYNKGTNCSLDHIQVMEVQSEETISRGLICSGILTLKSNKSLRIVFHSDNDSTTGVSFNASWVSICGGTLDRNSGKLIGPDHASGYPENQICTWNITVLNGYMLSLNLNVDGYNKGTNCSLDHIQVMEVQSEETISRGLICSGILTLKSNKSLRIVFHSDNDSTTGVSFNASWVSICGGTLDRNSGKLIGPDHASGYPENQICTWNITVLNGYMLSLNLNVDGYNKGTNCSLDHIQVMEVQSEETISRGLICSGILTLKSNKSLRIVFHSDNDSTTGVSFNASWVSICGGTLDRNSGKLIGPDHASGYPENQICTWNITVLNGYMLSLNLNVDGYNKGTNCSLDHIQVMEVQSEETISRGLICSGILTLKSNKSLRIVFHSDNDSTTGVSFNASWVSICGGMLHGNSGKLIGPDHASGYLESQICIWNITVQNGYMMSLTLNVDGYNDCSLDYIQVVEVQSEKTINRGLICTGMLTLKSNKSMRIVFHSDNDSTTGLSFNASWVSISSTEVGRGEGRNEPNKAEDISGSTTVAVAAPMALVIFILICLLLVRRAKSMRCFSKEQTVYNTNENMYDSVNDIKMDSSKLEISKNIRILQKKSFNPQTFRRRLPTTPTGRLSAILAQVRQRIRFGNDIYDTAYDEPAERWHTEFRESKQENAHSEQEKISITNTSTRETFINPGYISGDNVDQVKTRSVCSNKSVDNDCVVNESTVETIDNDGYLTSVDFNSSLTGIHTSIADSDSMKLNVAIHHKEDKELNTPLCIGQDSVAYTCMGDFIETTNTSVCIKLDDGAEGKDLYGDKDETHGKQAAIKETRKDESTDSYLTLPTYPGS